MTQTLILSEDQEALLLKVFSHLDGVDDSISVPEKLEIALNALLNSFDSTIDALEEQAESGEAIDVQALRKAIQRTLSPDISTELSVSNEGAPIWGDIAKRFEDYAAEEPNTPIVVAAKAGDDFDRQAAQVVFQSFPKSDWNSEFVREMWKDAAAALRGRAAENVVDK